MALITGMPRRELQEILAPRADGILLLAVQLCNMINAKDDPSYSWESHAGCSGRGGSIMIPPSQVATRRAVAIFFEACERCDYKVSWRNSGSLQVLRRFSLEYDDPSIQALTEAVIRRWLCLASAGAGVTIQRVTCRGLPVEFDTSLRTIYHHNGSKFTTRPGQWEDYEVTSCLPSNSRRFFATHVILKAQGAGRGEEYE